MRCCQVQTLLRQKPVRDRFLASIAARFPKLGEAEILNITAQAVAEASPKPSDDPNEWLFKAWRTICWRGDGKSVYAAYDNESESMRCKTELTLPCPRGRMQSSAGD